MDTMQAFYNQLFSGGKSRNGYFSFLARLARCSREQLAVLESSFSWDPWQSE